MWRRDRMVHFKVGSRFHGGASCKSAHFFVPFSSCFQQLVYSDCFSWTRKISWKLWKLRHVNSTLLQGAWRRKKLDQDSSWLTFADFHSCGTVPTLWCVDCVRVIVRVDPGVKCKHKGGLKAMDYLLYYPRYVVTLLSWTPTLISKWQGL